MDKETEKNATDRNSIVTKVGKTGVSVSSNYSFIIHILPSSLSMKGQLDFKTNPLEVWLK